MSDLKNENTEEAVSVAIVSLHRLQAEARERLLHPKRNRNPLSAHESGVVEAMRRTLRQHGKYDLDSRSAEAMILAAMLKLKHFARPELIMKDVGRLFPDALPLSLSAVGLLLCGLSAAGVVETHEGDHKGERANYWRIKRIWDRPGKEKF